VDSLTLERVTLDSADQRAGRAARLGPGLVRRLWDARDRLRPYGEPEIARVDLGSPVLDLLAWGADPVSFDWFEPPPVDRIEDALHLLHRLGATDADAAGARITTLGRQLQRIPVHPRLGRILIDARFAADAAQMCARLSERGAARDALHIDRIARELQRLAGHVIGQDVAGAISDEALRHAIFTGYADRLARRRDGTRDRFLLATGHGATLAREAGDVSAELIVALDIVSSEREGISESRIREASRVEREWVEPTETATEHRFDPESGRVRAARVERYDAIVLNETPIAPDSAIAAGLLRDAWLAREPDAATSRLLRRLRFAGIEIDIGALVHGAASSARTIDDIDLEAHLGLEPTRILNDRAPGFLVVPSGRHMRLEYGDDGSVSASVKLQELFGLAASPVIGPARVPVTFHLLAPNGRPVQTTRDLRSFWERTYPEVRRELRGRYPKHPWPDDPWTAQPTHRTIRRR
jgi:ATP-dependent helicase HrpB